MTRPLSPQQEQAIVLDRKGLDRDQIADELGVSNDHLSMVFRRAQAKGYEIPPPLGRRPKGVPTEKFLEVRAQLIAAGETHTPDINRAIAERFSVDYHEVRMRLRRYDRAQALKGDGA